MAEDLGDELSRAGAYGHAAGRLQAGAVSFRRDDAVVTPTGETARVVCDQSGAFVNLRYDDALRERDAYVELHR